MNLSRRSALFGGLVAAVCAPAVIRTPGLLMPIKSEREAAMIGVTARAGIGQAREVQGSCDGVTWMKVGETPCEILAPPHRFIRLMAAVPIASLSEVPDFFFSAPPAGEISFQYPYSVDI